MENQNKLEIKKGELKLQNIPNHITFDKLDLIESNKLGKREIERFVEKMKYAVKEVATNYINHGESYSLPMHIEFRELEKLIENSDEYQEEILDELSLLFNAIVLYNLSEHYKNKLLSADRNDHHAYMFQTVNKFARKFYSDYMLEGTNFHIVDYCIMDYEMDFLLYWLEFATAATKEEWTI